MDAIHITTHTIDAINRLLYQYQNATDLKKLIKGICGDRTQLIEDMLIALRYLIDINNATDAQLDGLGSILGETRKSRSDDDYRLIIMTRIGINISAGTPNDLISIYKILTVATHVIMQELYPAALQMFSDGIIDVGLQAEVKNYIQLIAPAGVNISEIGIYEEPSFTIGDASMIIADGAGFGDATNITLGGKLSYLI